MKKPKSRSNLIWLTVLGALIVLSGIAAVLLPRMLPKGTTAGVYVDGKRVEVIDLARVRESYTFSVTGKSGLTNIVEVEPGRIRVRKLRKEHLIWLICNI